MEHLEQFWNNGVVMNFTSQICTTKEQSERLLAMRLKKETADMCWNILTLHGTPVTYPSQDVWLDYSIISDTHFPAWSLHRLIEIADTYIEFSPFTGVNFQDAEFSTNRDNDYDAIIDIIEWLINEGHFNKEYLEE